MLEMSQPRPGGLGSEKKKSERRRCGTRKLTTRPPFQIARQKTLRLPLHNLIKKGFHPGFGRAIIFNHTMTYRLMRALIHILKRNLHTLVFTYRKTHAICLAIIRHTFAMIGITQIAEIPQLNIVRGYFNATGSTRAAIAGAQWQTRGERPANRQRFLNGIEEGASHNKLILVAQSVELCTIFLP